MDCHRVRLIRSLKTFRHHVMLGKREGVIFSLLLIRNKIAYGLL